MKEKILNRIFDFFVESPDFNGISLSTLCEEFAYPRDFIIDTLAYLVIDDMISIQYTNMPHGILYKHYPKDYQLMGLDHIKTNMPKIRIIAGRRIEVSEYSMCIYPSINMLEKTRDTNSINQLPYTLQLSLGQPQLKPIFFEIEVLDKYFNDPRYNFDFDDYSGSISKIYEDESTYSTDNRGHKDNVFIKTFGLGYDEQGNRLAVVYLYYLNSLSKSHQDHWNSKEFSGPAEVVKNYHDNTILGIWNFSHSKFSALLGELSAINTLSHALFGKKLFKNVYEGEKRPKEFTFFFIPTLKHYNDFIHLLDKILSDNIDKNFFKGTLELFEKRLVENDEFERIHKATITLLKEWLSLQYPKENQISIENIITPLKEIRKKRQLPAHVIQHNEHDIKYTNMQKEDISVTYEALKNMRKLFQQNPQSKNIKLPKWLDEGPIEMF